jgi:hypothetical protein
MEPALGYFLHFTKSCCSARSISSFTHGVAIPNPTGLLVWIPTSRVGSVGAIYLRGPMPTCRITSLRTGWRRTISGIGASASVYLCAGRRPSYCDTTSCAWTVWVGVDVIVGASFVGVRAVVAFIAGAVVASSFIIASRVSVAIIHTSRALVDVCAAVSLALGCVSAVGVAGRTYTIVPHIIPRRRRSRGVWGRDGFTLGVVVSVSAVRLILTRSSRRRASGQPVRRSNSREPG